MRYKTMKYRIHREFNDRTWEEPDVCTDLSAYLKESDFENTVVRNTVRGQREGIEFKVSFSPIWSIFHLNPRWGKTEMKGEVNLKVHTTENQRQAHDILVLLAQYTPSHLRE